MTVFFSSQISAALHAEPLRLIGGPNRYSGNLEIFYNNTWGSICDDSFNEKAANVACRQLGFSKASNWIKDYGVIKSPYWLDDVKCLGNETSLAKCAHSNWGVNNCGIFEAAGVECQGNWCNGSVCPTNSTCFQSNDGELFYCQCPNGYYGENCQLGVIANGAVRLSGTSSSNSTGFVEIYENGLWGTICNIGLDLVSASVICKAAGFGKATNISTSTLYGRGKGKILFDSLKCNGNEASPLDCVRNIPANATCTHKMDATIICSSKS